MRDTGDRVKRGCPTGCVYALLYLGLMGFVGLLLVSQFAPSILAGRQTIRINEAYSDQGVVGGAMVMLISPFLPLVNGWLRGRRYRQLIQKRKERSFVRSAPY